MRGHGLLHRVCICRAPLPLRMRLWAIGSRATLLALRCGWWPSWLLVMQRGIERSRSVELMGGVIVHKVLMSEEGSSDGLLSARISSLKQVLLVKRRRREYLQWYRHI